MTRMDNGNIFGNVKEWDFEKYAGIIIYLNTYFEKCMDRADRIHAFESGQDDYCCIPVSAELLQKMEFEETLDEFYSEALVMQDDMILDNESAPLLKVCKDGEGLTLYVDPVILKAMADLPELDEELMTDED